MTSEVSGEHTSSMHHPNVGLCKLSTESNNFQCGLSIMRQISLNRTILNGSLEKM